MTEEVLKYERLFKLAFESGAHPCIVARIERLMLEAKHTIRLDKVREERGLK